MWRAFLRVTVEGQRFDIADFEDGGRWFQPWNKGRL